MELSRSARWLTILVLMLIFGATLFPSSVPFGKPFTLCLICGERGTADAILNLLLFAPLGYVFGASGQTVRRTLLLAAFVSCVIELSQLGIPGRAASIGDVFFNTLGAGVGIAVHVTRPAWLRPGGRGTMWLSIGATGAAVGAFALTAVLLAPSLPRTTYYGQWTPNLGHLEWYRGRVLDATIGSMPLPGFRLPQSDSVRRLVLDGAPLEVRAIAGPPVQGLGSLVSIFDESEREVMLLGPDRNDLVFRYRTRAASYRLDQPDLRLSGEMANTAVGDTMSIAVWNPGDGRCIALNGHRECQLGFTIGAGWTVLLYPESLPAVARDFLGVLWITMILVPFGFWAAPKIEWLALGVVIALAMVIIPWRSGLLATPPAQWGGAALGVAIGALCRSFIKRHAT